MIQVGVIRVKIGPNIATLIEVLVKNRTIVHFVDNLINQN